MNAWSRDAILPLASVAEGSGAGPSSSAVIRWSPSAFGNISMPNLFGGVLQSSSEIESCRTPVVRDRQGDPFSGPTRVDIDGDFLVAVHVGTNGGTGGVFARNQGGKDGLGRSASDRGSTPRTTQAAISGDTLFSIDSLCIDLWDQMSTSRTRTATAFATGSMPARAIRLNNVEATARAPARPTWCSMT